MLFYCSFLVVTLVASCISGHHVGQRIYKEMCGDDSDNFRSELSNCLSEMPRGDQLIFQLCGSAQLNDTTDDYNVIMEDMCQDVSFASKVGDCINHISHIFHHFNKTDYRDHHPRHHHDKTEIDDDDDDKAGNDEEDDEDDDDQDDDDQDEHDEDHHKHDHAHDNSPHHHDFGHGIYNEECFQRLYNMFNITNTKEEKFE